jgi:integrase
VAHCETVLRSFYEFHLEAGTGPMVNPFPLARGRRGRANAHRNPMEPFRAVRAGRYRPRVAARIPRQIPDEKFDELFAGLGSHRDRALVAFWVSTGARAAELLGTRRADADPGQQLITVIRKGTRALQPLPASPDAFVWLRLYQAQMQGLVPAGPDDPLWWTLRRPFRPLSYHAARAMFTRAGAALGGRWRLHDLRHTAAYRMARDPAMPLTDVQWVLGHAHLSTTQLYLTAPEQDVIAAVVAHHARSRGRQPAGAGGAGAAAGYRPESLSVLFGQERQ